MQPRSSKLRYITVSGNRPRVAFFSSQAVDSPLVAAAVWATAASLASAQTLDPTQTLYYTLNLKPQKPLSPGLAPGGCQAASQRCVMAVSGDSCSAHPPLDHFKAHAMLRGELKGFRRATWWDGPIRPVPAAGSSRALCRVFVVFWPNARYLRFGGGGGGGGGSGSGNGRGIGNGSVIVAVVFRVVAVVGVVGV